MKTQPPSSARLSLREFIFSQLRVKLTFPYVLLAIVLAIVATFIATQIIARDIEERFNRNLADSGQLASDGLVTIERDQLALLRGVAHTEGLPEAVQSGNNQQVVTLAAPLALNGQGELIDIVDLNGKVLMAMHHRAGSSRADDYMTNETTRYQDWAIVQRVVAGETDQGQDKFADLIQTPWGYALYTAGPIKVGEQLVGVVLVGSRADTIVPRLAQDSLKAVTLYLPNGQALATTLSARDLAQANLSADQYQNILQSSATNTFVRPITFGATLNDYSEAFGIFGVRPNQALALFSVAGSREGYIATADNEIRLNMTLLFGLGLVTIIFIGILIANSIVRPVLSLVEATRKLSDGDFDARVKVNSPDEIGVLALAFNRMAEGLKEREFIKDLFGRVVSAEVRESLIESARDGGILLGGELRQVTMLFTDIRDFTSLSESYNPGDVVSFLNEFFTAMLEVVNRFGGMVNKFGGDSTLVIFGAPVEQSDHARRAVACALALRERVLEFNASRRERGYEAIRIGIGVNTGSVVAGQIGSPGRFEYTVIGDAVNVTSRLEGLTREFVGQDILISETTFRALGMENEIQVKDLGQVRVKGKQESIHIYGVLGKPDLTPLPLLVTAEAHTG